MSRPPVVGAEMGQGAAPPRTCLFPYKMGQWEAATSQGGRVR